MITSSGVLIPRRMEYGIPKDKVRGKSVWKRGVLLSRKMVGVSRRIIED